MDKELFDKQKTHNGPRRKTTEPRIGIKGARQFELNEAASGL